MTRTCTADELKVIKAIIGADVSNSNWDVDAFQKALKYQGNIGLVQDGKIGIATLKTILNDANKILDNTPNKQSLINFLRYMINKRS